ncbi:MAG: SGNH/GDSL hydrolase family protein [Planctomycetia bacterium]|nr:SGNH/GDSL hydrolase family protein [Planctomycetia bacterium]
MRYFLTLGIFFTSLVCTFAQEELRNNFACHERGGIGNTLEKLRKGETVRVAYLGGSITMAGNGWRSQTTAWLQEAYPDADVREINAGVSGTGSRLADFRLGRDVLSQRPDLLFIEFAVNDGGESVERIQRQMEGLVLQTWQANPRTDIVFVYTFCTGFARNLRDGKLPRSASAMEAVADFYGIPSVNFMKRVVEMEAAGRLVFTSDRPSTDAVLVFSKDGTHPGPEGHALYVQDLREAFDKMNDSSPQTHRFDLARTFSTDPILDGKMFAVTASMLRGNWKKMESGDRHFHFTQRLDEIWTTDTPGDSLTFSFRGTEAYLYDVVGPDGGQVWVTVDGKKSEKPLPRNDRYCIDHRSYRVTYGLVAAGLDPTKVHTVTLTLDTEKPFVEGGGRMLRVAKILLRGALCEPD